MNLADNELLVIGASADTARYFFEKLSKRKLSKKNQMLVKKS